MKRPIISIDIDDVLSESASSFVAFSNKHWGTNLTAEDYNDDWAKMWNMEPGEATNAELKTRGDEYHKTVLNHSSLNAHQALEKLKKDFDLILVTSRRTSMKGDTLTWIQREFPGIFLEDKIFFAGMWDVISEHSAKVTKGELLKELGSSYHIDDQPKHCFAALENGITPLLFGEYGWNREVEVPKGMVRVKDWFEVVEYFDALQEK
ncbi:MAG: hypothetical protein V4611_04315 [Patescibacteria group bacterium]